MGTTPFKTFLLGLGAILVAGAIAASALGAMRSDRIDRNLCETTGGARVVGIPGFPGERIDRRLLSDIRFLERRYKIFVTDGYSTDPVHSANGEHPMGLALDIVPNTAAGGTWRDISALARWAEPEQNQPVAPFRWVGYNGDSGHGRGHHLHLSWNHSETRIGVAPTTVYSLRCPSAKVPSGGGGGAGGGGEEPTDPEEPKGGDRDGKGGGGKGGDDGGSTGGVQPGSGGSNGGGISPGRVLAPTQMSAGEPVVETGGVGIR